MLKINFSKVAPYFLIALAFSSCKDHRKPIVDQNREKGREEIVLADSVLETKKVTEAVVHVKGVGDHKVTGKITFTQVTGGVRIVGDVDGLKPGEHGFHVHEHGDCGGKDAAAAGGHFNPTNKPHGGPDSPERHVGDLGNLVADANGLAHYDRIDKVISLEGENSIIGRSIVIHADRDDYTTQPTGASGPRIGCGLIEASTR
jgi:Cu-Zn family superoxide dismutase